MRILVLSDIHANLTALETVLKDAGSVDEVWCLGDLVGYGPDPNECVALMRSMPHLTCMLGNHDVAALGGMEMEVFNADAKKSLQWQKETIKTETSDYLKSLPEETIIKQGISLVHGSPRDPIWEYILNTLIARLNFEAFETDYCFVGHTHIQCMFHLDTERDRVSLDIPKAGEVLKLHPRAILNPGSVGQPRDRDPRAAYAFFDPEAGTWEPRRVEYDIKAVQKRIRDAGLPDKHAVRLAEGW